MWPSGRDGVDDNTPDRICDKLRLVEVRAWRELLPPGSNQGAYAEGIGDGPKCSSNERKRGAGKPPPAGIKMGLIILDGISPRRLLGLVMLCCLGLLAVKGLDVVFDPVTTVGHHLGRGSGCASRGTCLAVTR